MQNSTEEKSDKVFWENARKQEVFACETCKEKSGFF